MLIDMRDHVAARASKSSLAKVFHGLNNGGRCLHIPRTAQPRERYLTLAGMRGSGAHCDKIADLNVPNYLVNTTLFHYMTYLHIKHDSKRVLNKLRGVSAYKTGNFDLKNAE